MFITVTVQMSSVHLDVFTPSQTVVAWLEDSSIPDSHVDGEHLVVDWFLVLTSIIGLLCDRA
jgi:hypothetical protein